LDSVGVPGTTLNYDPSTGLRAQTQWGRPKWDIFLTEVAQLYPGESCGVFLCGRRQFIVDVRTACELESKKVRGVNKLKTTFTVHKEIF